MPLAPSAYLIPPQQATSIGACRESDIDDLQRAIHQARLKVWGQQPDSFFDCARLDVDGTIVETSGECKEGIGLSYKGVWGYYPHLITLANTQEVLWLINQPGNDSSVQAAGDHLDLAARQCRAAGFRDVLMRGDTAFSFASRLDSWDQRGERFILGYSAHKTLEGHAQEMAQHEYDKLVRRANSTT